MISKYAYKNLTWVDLSMPSPDEVEHILELYPNKHLHFIIGDDFLITTRKEESVAIKEFAKNFENNIALQKPIETQNIDSLFFDLVTLFKKHTETKDIQQQIADKTEKYEALEYVYHTEIKKYRQKINYLKGMLGVLFFILIIIILILWL